MKGLLTAILTLATLCVASARQAPDDSTNYGWKNDLTGNVTLTQASFVNWQQGGENTLAWQAKVNGNFVRDEEKYNWANQIKATLGFAKVGDQEARKSADEIFVESVYTRKRSKLLNPFVAVTAKTQFVSGFEYNDDNKTKISRFLDPGYFTQSLGLGYKPNDRLQTRFGVLVKETITSDFPVPFADDASTVEIEKTKVEPGLSSVTDYKHALREDIIYTSKLDIFSDLEAFNRIDILWENNITLNITKIINVSFEFNLFYDRDLSSKRQIKQVLGLGLSYAFIE